MTVENRHNATAYFSKREFPEYMKYDLLPVMNKIGGMLVHPAIRRVLIENTEANLLLPGLEAFFR